LNCLERMLNYLGENVKLLRQKVKLIRGEY